MSISVSILGCGWLGFPLASRLLLRGMAMRGATTTPDKISLLTTQGIQPYLIRLNPLCIDDPRDFFNSDVLVITIPFRRYLPDPGFYKQQINGVIDLLGQQVLFPKIIFISSTAVYPNIDGAVYTEQDKFSADNDRSRILLDVETIILNVGGTVLRCGGLYGPGREIHRFFLKSTILKSAQGKMNLLHLDDGIGIIESVIEHKAWGQVINVVSDQHPTRQALYTHLAGKYGVAHPIFDDKATNALGKIVSNDKIKRVLEYRFIHPDPMDA